MPHHHCCVLGCRSDSRYSKLDESPSPTKESLRFFCVPSLTSKRALHNEWLKMIGRPELVVSRNTRVCSLHFMDGKPSKENPWPTLRLQNVNLPIRRRARSSKSTNLANGDTHLSEKTLDLKRIVKTDASKEISRERLFNCLKNGRKYGALNLKIVPSPLSPFQGLTENHLQTELAQYITMETQNCANQLIHFPTQEPDLGKYTIAKDFTPYLKNPNSFLLLPISRFERRFLPFGKLFVGLERKLFSGREYVYFSGNHHPRIQTNPNG